MSGPAARAIALLSPLLLALTGCGEDPEDGDSASADPVITLNDEANAWPDAQVTGTLELREGCLLIDDSVAVFPLGTTWRSSDVVFENGMVATVGAHVSMGGGWFKVADVAQDDLPIVPMDKVQACAERTGAADFVWAQPAA